MAWLRVTCPPPRGGHGRGEGPAPWRGPFLASFVLLWEEAKLRTEADGENLGLGFDKW